MIVKVFKIRLFKPYQILFKKVVDEYFPDENSEQKFEKIYLNELVDDVDDRFPRKSFPIKDFLSNFENNTIYKAILYDDIKSFIPFTEDEEFDIEQELHIEIYDVEKDYDFEIYDQQQEPITLLDYCCLYGSIDCFRFLRTKFKVEITDQSLNFSFLGGNPDIISEYLKNEKPRRECFKYAIASHNIDFVTFLMHEYHFQISFDDCGQLNNLEAFLVGLDQTKDLNQCFVFSPEFKLLSLCEYLISQGAKVKTKIEPSHQTALHTAAIANSKEIAELLISHNADVNAIENINYGCHTPFQFAMFNGSIETAELLISHGVNISSEIYVNSKGYTLLHHAALYNVKKSAEFLISNGVNINAINASGNTPLLYAAKERNLEVVELLVSKGANFRIFNLKGKSVIDYARRDREIYNILRPFDQSLTYYFKL